MDARFGTPLVTSVFSSQPPLNGGVGSSNDALIGQGSPPSSSVFRSLTFEGKGSLQGRGVSVLNRCDNSLFSQTAAIAAAAPQFSSSAAELLGTLQQARPRGSSSFLHPFLPLDPNLEAREFDLHGPGVFRLDSFDPSEEEEGGQSSSSASDVPPSPFPYTVPSPLPLRAQSSVEVAAPQVFTRSLMPPRPISQTESGIILCPVPRGSPQRSPQKPKCDFNGLFSPCRAPMVSGDTDAKPPASEVAVDRWIQSKSLETSPRKAIRNWTCREEPNTTLVVDQVNKCLQSVTKDPLKRFIEALFPVQGAAPPICSESHIIQLTDVFITVIMQKGKKPREKIEGLISAFGWLKEGWIKKKEMSKGIAKAFFDSLGELTSQSHLYVVAYFLENYLRKYYAGAALFFLEEMGKDEYAYHSVSLRDIWKLCPPEKNDKYIYYLHATNYNLVVDVVTNLCPEAYSRVVQIVTSEMEDEEALKSMNMMRSSLLINREAPYLCETHKEGILRLLHTIFQENRSCYRFTHNEAYQTLVKEVEKIHLLDLGHFTGPQYGGGKLVGFHLPPQDPSQFTVWHNDLEIEAIYIQYPRLVHDNGLFQAVYGATTTSERIVKASSGLATAFHSVDRKPSSFYPFSLETLLQCLNQAITCPFLTLREELPAQASAQGSSLVRVIGRFEDPDRGAIFSELLIRTEGSTEGPIKRIATGFPLVLTEERLTLEASIPLLDRLQLELESGKRVPFVLGKQEAKSEVKPELKCHAEEVLLERAAVLIGPLKASIAVIRGSPGKRRSPSSKEHSPQAVSPVGGVLRSSPTGGGPFIAGQRKVDVQVREKVKKELKAFLMPPANSPIIQSSNRGFWCRADAAQTGKLLIRMSFQNFLGESLSALIKKQLNDQHGLKMPACLEGFESPYYKMDEVSFFTTLDILVDALILKYGL